jgi:hypothetical protein
MQHRYSGAVGGKTGKTSVLPRFIKIEGGGGSGGCSGGGSGGGSGGSGGGSGGGAPQWWSHFAQASAPRRRRRCLSKTGKTLLCFRVCFACTEGLRLMQILGKAGYAKFALVGLSPTDAKIPHKQKDAVVGSAVVKTT